MVLYSCSTQIKEMAYKSHWYVQSIMDYCSPVWDPHTKNLTNQLEAIQNRAARFVSGIYGRDSSITKIKQDLKWETLQQRRTVDRLTIFQQAVAGNLAIPVQNVLRLVTRNLRNTSTTANSFIPIQANKNCYKYLHSIIMRLYIFASHYNETPL